MHKLQVKRSSNSIPSDFEFRLSHSDDKKRPDCEQENTEFPTAIPLFGSALLNLRSFLRNFGWGDRDGESVDLSYELMEIRTENANQEHTVDFSDEVLPGENVPKLEPSKWTKQTHEMNKCRHTGASTVFWDLLRCLVEYINEFLLQLWLCEFQTPISIHVSADWLKSWKIDRIFLD
jgi:hypothetical protein